jgi:hypothetical protein
MSDNEETPVSNSAEDGKRKRDDEDDVEEG